MTTAVSALDLRTAEHRFVRLAEQQPDRRGESESTLEDACRVLEKELQALQLLYDAKELCNRALSKAYNRQREKNALLKSEIRCLKKPGTVTRDPDGSPAPES